MDLRRLTYFLAVAEHGSFSEAARAIPVSQPALSLSIKELERELGAMLFSRLPRQVVLTPAGQALVGPARQVMRDVEAGRNAVGAVTGLAAGRLALSSLPTLAADPLAALIGQFRTTHPAVVIDLADPENSDDLLDMIDDGRCELGITEPTQRTTHFVTHRLADQDLYVIMPSGTRIQAAGNQEPLNQAAGDQEPLNQAAGDQVKRDLAAGDQVKRDLNRETKTSSSRAPASLSLSHMRDSPFIATPPGTSSRRLLEEGFASVGLEPRVAVVTAQREAVIPLVLAGAGCALLPSVLAGRAASLGAEVARPDPPILRRTVVVHRDGPLTPAASRFVELAMFEQAAGSG